MDSPEMFQIFGNSGASGFFFFFNTEDREEAG